MAKHARHSSHAGHAGRRVGAGKKSALRTILPAAAGLGVLFLAYKAIAGETPKLPDKPVTPVDPNKPKPPPGPPWPAGTPTARVTVTTGQNGMNTRTAPNLTAPFVHHNDAHNGSRVGVFAIDIPEEGGACPSCLWWKIMTPGGSVGYSRAVGPQGEHNFTPDGALPEQPITPPLVVAAAGEEMPGLPIGAGPSVGRSRMRAAAYFGRRPVN